jgi:hypothetical protein
MEALSANSDPHGRSIRHRGRYRSEADDDHGSTRYETCHRSERTIDENAAMSVLPRAPKRR